MELLIKEPSRYFYISDPDRLDVIRLKNEIKTCGAVANEGVSTILFYVLRTISLTITAGLPSTI